MIKVFEQIDSGELAARLGSIDTFDRRGNIVWMDDFESPTLKWAETSVGAGNSKEYSAARSFMGSTSMKLTTGAVEDNALSIEKMFSLPSSTKMGLEARIFMETEDTYADLLLYGYSGGRLYFGQVRWSFTDETFSYYNSAGNPVVLKTDAFNETGEETWMPIKLVIDYSTLKYVRAIFGRDEYDLSAQSLPSFALARVDSVLIVVTVTAAADAASVIYVDNVIFTQTEP